MFDGYLKPVDACERCGLRISGHQADDLPPYLVVLIAGKVSIGAMVLLDRLAEPPVWALTLAIVALALGLSLSLIRPIKGLVIGLQWANEMHGFSPDATAQSAESPTSRT